MQPPDWYFNANCRLPEECRARCSLCLGHGSTAGSDLVTCRDCMTGYRPCSRHMCRQCSGTGLCCPFCGGMRYVRSHDYTSERGPGQVERCLWCTEGNNVHPIRENEAVTAYMVAWRRRNEPTVTLRMLPYPEDMARDDREENEVE